MNPIASSLRRGFFRQSVVFFATFWLFSPLLPAAAIPLPSQWLTNWTGALAQARDREKPVLLFITAEWCAPCAVMKQNVFPQVATQRELDQWTPVALDERKDRELVKTYHVTGYPTFIFMTAEGREVNRRVGAMSQADFLKVLGVQRELIEQTAQMKARIKKDPKNPQGYKDFGDLLERGGKYEDAEKVYRLGIGTDPADKTGMRADLLFVKGLMLSINQPDEARAILQQVEARYPGSPRASHSLYIQTLMALNSGDNKLARALCADYLGKYPNGEFKTLISDYLKRLNNPAVRPALPAKRTQLK